MDLFGGLMKGLKPLMNVAGVQADDEMKAAMLQGEVAELEEQRHKVLANIGEVAYEMAKTDNWEREKVLSLCAKVDNINTSIKEKKDEAEKAKQVVEEKKKQEEAKLAARTCPACGEVSPEGTKFCQFCGSKLGVVKPAQNICSNCGAVNDAESRFCGECGASINSVQVVEIKCPGCGTVHPVGTRFCNQCGSRL